MSLRVVSNLITHNRSQHVENDHTWAFWSRLPPGQASPSNDIVVGSRYGTNGADTSPREFIKFTPNRFEYHMNGGFGDDLDYANSNLPADDMGLQLDRQRW